MPRHDKKGRRKSGPPFVQLFRHMMESPAWRTLKPAARVVYTQIALRYNGSNNGQLAASIRDLAAECLADPKTVTASINELIARGLIERTQEGSFSCKVKLAAEFRLTAFRCDKTGRSASHAFRSWTTSGPRAVEGEINYDESGS